MFKVLGASPCLQREGLSLSLTQNLASYLAVFFPPPLLPTPNSSFYFFPPTFSQPRLQIPPLGSWPAVSHNHIITFQPPHLASQHLLTSIPKWASPISKEAYQSIPPTQTVAFRKNPDAHCYSDQYVSTMLQSLKLRWDPRVLGLSSEQTQGFGYSTYTGVVKAELWK